MQNLCLRGERRRCQHGANNADTKSSHYSLVDLCPLLDLTGADEECTALLYASGIVAKVNDANEAIWTCDLNQVVDDSESSKPSSNKDTSWFRMDAVELAACPTALVCQSHQGAIVTVDAATGEAELVGAFENGIYDACWSPDGQVLLLVTTAESEDNNSESDEQGCVLLSMNADWDVLAEVNMEPFVSTIPNKHNNTNENFDHKINVSWRPDGTLCAVSSVDAVDNIRRIRILDRDMLTLKSVGRSEDGTGKVVPNLQPSISWAGTGCSHLVSSVQKKGKSKQQVVFFESNGLRHGEFLLSGAANNMRVVDMIWNSDSSLMALFVQVGNGDDPDAEVYSKVQLWHRSNYHWYLKQEFTYKPQEQITRIQFHEEHSNFLYVLLGDNSWCEYTLRWDASTLLSYETGESEAYVVDGCSLNITPLHQAIVPPPMSAGSLSFPCAVNHVAICQSPHPVAAIACLSDGSFRLLMKEGGERSQMIPRFTLPKISGDVDSLIGDTDLGPTRLRGLTVIDSSSADSLSMAAIVCEDAARGEAESVLSVRVDLTNNVTVVLGRMSLENRVISMVSWSCGSPGALIMLQGGDMLELEIDGNETSIGPSSAEPLLEPCPWIAGIKNVDAAIDSHDENEAAGQHDMQRRLVVGLSSRFRLYCHDLLLAESASSFFLSVPHQFLCLVTAGSRCQLRFIGLVDLLNFDPLMGSEETGFIQGFEPRNVERGAQLVAIPARKPTAILQMPRGNLEGVYPRALVIRYCVQKISESRYKEAFEMMRRQKVDLNLVVDIAPRHFLSKAGGLKQLVEQVSDIDHLNIFISSLKSYDITQSKQHVPHWLRRYMLDEEDDPLNPFDFSTKVNQVCQTMRQIMEDMETCGQTKNGRKISKGHFLLPVLSTFAKESPPKLEDALELIKTKAIEDNPAGSNKPAMFSDTAQSSIRYLAFLAEYELLFNTSLGMYAYDIARAVARNSQMDPKSYLPQLKRYRELPQYYGRHEVDLKLNRFDIALRNLNQSRISGETPYQDDHGNGFTECMNLIDKHALHKVGLELFTAESERFKILISLGDKLLEDKKASEALAIFMNTQPNDRERIKAAAHACNDWRTFIEFSVIDMDSGVIEEQKYILAHQLADKLASTSDGLSDKREIQREAAIVLLDYAKDVPAAVDMLVRGELWDEARRICTLHNRDDLVKSVVDGAISYSKVKLVEFEEKADDFCRANSRYADVITLRREAVASGEAEPGETEEIRDDSSLFSMASNASNFSMLSTTSSSSTGSSASLSSVISVKSSTTFSMVGTETEYRHKSSFNKIGRDKKRKKKRRQKAPKLKPGSAAELNLLVEKLRISVLDTNAVELVEQTVNFLLRNSAAETARALYDAFVSMRTKTIQASIVRIRKDVENAAAKQQKEFLESSGGTSGSRLPIEKEIDALCSADFSLSLHSLMAYF